MMCISIVVVIVEILKQSLHRVAGKKHSKIHRMVQAFQESSENILNMKSRKRLEYCLGSTADIEVGS